MLCIKKSYFLSIFALFAVLFGSFIFTSKNVSALSDLTISSPFTRSTICDNSNSSLPDCGYHYIVLSCSSLSLINSDAYIYANITYHGVGANYYLYPFFNQVFDFSSDPITKFTISNFSGFPSSYSCSITLTDNDPFSCSCPTCPEVPDNPYDPKFDELKQAILIIPATALVIYFFFCIYRMLLKGRE